MDVTALRPDLLAEFTGPISKGRGEKGEERREGREGREVRRRECLTTFTDLLPPLHTVQVRGGSTLPVLMSPTDYHGVFTATLYCLHESSRRRSKGAYLLCPLLREEKANYIS